MLLEPNYNTIPNNGTDMSSYSTMMTPPSSNEDSPPTYFVASPTSTSFQGPEVFGEAMDYMPINITTNGFTDPAMIEYEDLRAELKFVEQPTDRFRFRYKSEMAGTHGSLTGMSSDRSRKQTFPTVELLNFTGKAIVRCSIYQVNAKDKEIMPHAHRLIMKNGKEEQDDPHDIIVGPEQNYKARFNGMGIIHTAKKNIVGELIKKKTQLKKEEIARMEGKIRELNTKELMEIKGLAETESKSINLNIVCLRFDAFIEQGGILYPICPPIFSHGINNLKSALTGDLRIVRLDRVVCEAKGGKEIFLLVERVTKKNIRIRFFELDDQEQQVWEGWGQFNDLDVHHQYAIVFKTPKYHDQNITKPVKVYIELVRPTDDARSEPREFRYIPNKDVQPGMKRRRYDYSTSYSSSEFGSDELPATIGSVKSEQEKDKVQINAPPFVDNLSSVPIPDNLSEELKKAMTEFNSAEFNNLVNKFSDEIFVLFDTDSPQDFITNTYSKYSSSLQQKLSMRQQLVTDAAAPVKLEVNQDDRHKAAKFMDELKSFVKTCKNNLQRAQAFLNTYLGKDKQTNALHVLISLNKIHDVVYVIQHLKQFKMLDLLKKRNDEDQSPLQLAILCHNVKLVLILLKFSASVTNVDANLNTALHYAIRENASNDILELLLLDRQEEKVANYIDLKNTEGNTALFIAVEKNNLPAVKMLCSKGANINEIHPKNGYVPLRTAIEKQHTAIVKYLLTLKDISTIVKDFAGLDPLTAAVHKEISSELREAVEKYMRENDIRVEIKQEDTDSEDETEDETEIKSEPMNVEDLEDLYQGVKTFTPKYLEEISQIVDSSNNWGFLAELLGVDHLVSSGIITDRSMTKAVLKYATETSNDASVWEIRNFLESLDETRAVQMIDRMVHEMKYSRN